MPDTQGAPVYIQVQLAVRRSIASGHWPPGMPLPPVLELSRQFGVNPNTALRALAELDRERLIDPDPAGWRVTRDPARVEQLRDEMAREFARTYYKQMQAIGFQIEGMADLLQRTSLEEGERPGGPEPGVVDRKW